jgi:hypothetical protein
MPFFLALFLLCSMSFFSASQPADATSPTPVDGVEGAHLKEILPLRGTLYHVQGVDLDGEHIWVTSVDSANHKGYLHQFNRASGAFERQVEVTDGPRFHPGGFSIEGDSIWIPVAEYRPQSSAVIEELDKHSLAVKQKIAVADHLGCLAVTPEGLIAGNWGSRRFYLFDRQGHQLRSFENLESNAYQDMKFVAGKLVASGTFTHAVGSIDWYSWPSMKLTRRLHAGVTDRGKPYTEEGMALQGKDLYLLPEDGPSRLFHFVLAD